MPNSYVTFTGNGSTTTFSFAGIDDYLSTGYIKVYVDNALVATNNYTINVSGGNENVIFNTAPANGATVKIARETPSTSAGFASNIIDFTDGSVLTATDLDKGFKGLLHIVQEANDTGSGALGKTADGLNWDAQQKRITNGAAGLDQGDFVTKAQLDAVALYGAPITLPQAWEFTGNGSATEFTFNPEANATDPNMFIVEVGGVLQRPSGLDPDYSITASKLTFLNGAPGNGVGIRVRNFGVARAALDVIAVNSITSAYLQDGSVTTVKLAANAVTAEKLADNSVDSAAIQAGSVISGKLGANSILSANIQDLQVVEAKIGNEAVTTNKIGQLAVSEAKIGTGAVTGSKIASDSITYDKLQRGTTAPGVFAASGAQNRYMNIAPSGALTLANVSSIPVGTPTTDVSFQSTTGNDGYTAVNLRNPTNARDAATKGYVDSKITATVSSSADADLTDFAIGTTIIAHITGTALQFTTSLGNVSIAYRNRNVQLYPYVGLATDSLQYLANSTATAPSNTSTTPLVGTWLFRGVCSSSAAGSGDWLPVLLQRVS
jgi:hypothetical protein